MTTAPNSRESETRSLRGARDESVGILFDRTFQSVDRQIAGMQQVSKGPYFLERLIDGCVDVVAKPFCQGWVAQGRPDPHYAETGSDQILTRRIVKIRRYTLLDILLNVDQTCEHVSIGVRHPFSGAFGRVLAQVSMTSKQLGDAPRIGIENRSNDRLKLSQRSAKRETMPHSNLTSFTQAGTKDFIDRSSVFRAQTVRDRPSIDAVRRNAKNGFQRRVYRLV